MVVFECYTGDSGRSTAVSARSMGVFECSGAPVASDLLKSLEK